jgi:glutaminyl-tRNA synthetase
VGVLFGLLPLRGKPSLSIMRGNGAAPRKCKGPMEPTSKTSKSNFIRDIIDEDLASGRHTKVVTRFPPEPNGYLHIGHAKSICLNFGLARDYNGVCHLRFDDTNPTKEEVEYVDAIQYDVKWLGFDWNDKLFFASDYFEKLYEIGVHLIKKGKAYVDSLSMEEIREYRGSLTEPGKESPYRNRSVEENLDLFAKMRAGVFPDGAHVLRAKIDMSAKNMLMRDMILYRIRHAHHHRTGDAWCLYPMYDYAHPLSDAIESITHSICTLEFDNNREFYDWVVAEARELLPATPHQYEFARLNLEYTMMSKRNLLKLVEEKLVSGWDDPRMPTIAGLRRRGYTPEAIRDFAEMVGVAKANSLVDYAKLEYCIRNDLNYRAPRRMCVLDPIKVVITNYPEGKTEELEAADFPPDVNKPGSHPMTFSREVYIERSDFEQDPPKGFHRLSPGSEVRLTFAYIIKCEEAIIKDGKVVEIHCTYDPDTKSSSVAHAGQSTRKVKSAIHWVSVAQAVPCEVRMYDRLFSAVAPGAERDFHEDINPHSLSTITQAFVEPAVANDEPGSRYQFTRQGFFFSDPIDSKLGKLIFNRIVSLRDSWAKQSEEASAKPEPVKLESEPKAKGEARPNKKSPNQKRTTTREENPSLKASYDRYQNELKLSEEDADLLTGELELSAFFDAALLAYNNAASISKWVINELMREVKDRSVNDILVKPAQLSSLAKMVDTQEISASAAKTVFAKMVAEGGEPKSWVEKLGLQKVVDQGSLITAIDKIIAANPDSLKKYKEGKKNLLGFFVGAVMKETNGSADPTMTRELLTQKLEA